MLPQRRPEFFLLDIIAVVEILVRRSIKCCHTKRHDTTDDVLVVAVEFGKCFLHQWSPERFISADMTEDCAVSTSESVFLEWELVVNDLGIRNTKSIEVESVDASLIEGIVLNNSIKSVWVLSQSCCSCQIPAISD